jgi:uncharacterized protein (TIGR00269 family)
MLSVNDHVALALSGGKDSLTLLRVLNRIEKKFPDSQITAVTVDEGIEGYRTEAISIARDQCAKYGVDHRIVSFKELYGYTLDELVSERRLAFPCSYCGVLRRKAINSIARKVRATKIATAHNMDDEVQTFVLNMFHGDVPRIARSDPSLEDPSGMFLPRVKPLAESPEKEIVLYAHTTGIDFQTVPCPYASTALRNDIRTMLNRLEVKHVGIKFTIYRSVERLRELLKNSRSDFVLRRCDSCGEPTASNRCEACKLLNGVDEQ